MSFEEFLKEKKIDVAAATSMYPLLINEMRRHFEQSGPVATDQFYKFSFNELRKTCRLQES